MKKNPFAGVEEDDDELEKNETVSHDCQNYLEDVQIVHVYLVRHHTLHTCLTIYVVAAVFTSLSISIQLRSTIQRQCLFGKYCTCNNNTVWHQPEQQKSMP